MRNSRAPRSLTACWIELGMLTPADVKSKKNWTDKAKECWRLLDKWLKEDENRTFYNNNRGGTSQFEERARTFVHKYGPVIWPASNTNPQAFAYPRNFDAIVLRVQDLICHRIENKWDYATQKNNGIAAIVPGGEVISTNEFGVGDLPQKLQPPKQVKPSWQAKRRRSQMPEDESDEGVSRKTKWIDSPMDKDSDSPSIMTERETTEEYMQKHQTPFKKRKTNAPVPASETARVVQEKNSADRTSKTANSHSKTTSRYSQSTLGAKSQSPSLLIPPSPKAGCTTPVQSIAPCRALQTVHTSSTPREATDLPVETLHTSQISPPMKLDLPLKVNCAPPTPSTIVPDLPDLDPNQLAQAFFPVELVGISYLRMLYLCDFDSPTTLVTALRRLWGLGPETIDIDHVGVKYLHIDGVIELRKGNAKDFKGLMTMIAKWLDTLKPNEIAGLCPSIFIKIYKNTAETFNS